MYNTRDLSKDLIVKAEETNWMSKKELASMCNVDEKTIQRVANDIFTLDTDVQSKTHIKKGGYHNLETYYDDYLVKLIQAKLLSNQANQGRASDTIKSIVKTAVKNEDYIYSAKEIWELSSSSSRTWDRFVAEFLSATDGEQKTDYLEEHPSRSGGNKYTEKTLKTFQAWLLDNL